MLLQGKTAIITGCNRGIGKAILETFAENGADIFACVRKESDEFTEIKEKLEDKTGVTITPVFFDFSESEQVKAGIKTIMSAKKKIDVLVNADTAPWPDPIDSTLTDECVQAVNVNISGQALTSDEMLPFMSIQKTGGLMVGVAVEDEVMMALKTIAEPGLPSSVAAVISPMTALAASRGITLRVLPAGRPEELAEVVVGLVNG